MKSIPETQKMKQFSAQTSHEQGGQQEGSCTEYFDNRWRAGGGGIILQSIIPL